MTNSNKISQKVRFLLLFLPLSAILAYLYWWLTRPTEKRLASVEIEAPSPLEGPPATKRDDLTKIKGIGPKISEAFQSQGIHLYYQIALMSADEIKACLSEQVARLANSDTWPQQARLAALEEWEQLEVLQESI